MNPEAARTRRPRPAHDVSTTSFSPSPFPSLSTVPITTMSASSVASSPRDISPIMSPDGTAVTTNSSVQPSPASLHGRDPLDQLPPQSFQLPESIIRRKTSTGSIAHSFRRAPSPAQEAAGKGLVRRLSNKASKIVTRRRTSSATPMSREGSVGPAMVRKRSGSTAASQLDGASSSNAALLTDSDDSADDHDDFAALARNGNLNEVILDALHAHSRRLVASGDGSLNGGTSSSDDEDDEPVWPLQLVHGSWIKKVSKKRTKRICLVLEPADGRISWDHSRPDKCVYVDYIKDIRYGSDIRQYRIDCGTSASDEDRWFTINYTVPDKSRVKTLHLVADDEDTFHRWVTCLEQILQHRQESMASLMAFRTKAVKKYWRKEMARRFGKAPRKDSDETLDFQSVVRVCRNLHIHIPVSIVESKFHYANKNRSGRLNLTEFQDFAQSLRWRDDIAEVFAGLTQSTPKGMALHEFLGFLRDVQHEDVAKDAAKWQKVFTEYSRTYARRQTAEPGQQSYPEEDETRISHLSCEGFVAFMKSSYCRPLVEPPAKITLDRPMNEYYISSSHNTYLLGRQVADQSSVEGYISALKRGCRCVEVDCWDGSDGQPVVLHGRAMTTSISFREAMTTIRKYAFEVSMFPLWISLEVHTNPSQQATMASIIKETFGKLLVTEPLEGWEHTLPSPAALLGRVLIKVKKPIVKEEPRSTDLAGRRRGNSLTAPYANPMADVVAPPLSVPQSPILTPTHSSKRLASRTRVDPIAELDVSRILEGCSSDGEMPVEFAPSATTPSPPLPENKTERVLGDLGVYCAGVKFRGFDTPDAKAFNHIFSFMETSFAKYSKPKEAKQALDRHNMRYLMRVYPNQIRITSNNFDPLVYWRRGVQMAAMNWQTFDLGMQLNKAMFEGGQDSSGYVLKPSELREIKLMRDPWTGKHERKTVTFSIEVISAQQLLRPNGLSTNKQFNPYITVEVIHPNGKQYKKEGERDVKADPDSPLNVRTKISRGNGFNPRFNDQFNFKVTTKYPDLIFVRFAVRHAPDPENPVDRPPVATYTAKLRNLKRGYRILPLFSNSAEEFLFSTLFCQIQVDPISSVMLEAHDEPQESTSKLRGLGLNVFTRSNGSPKSSIEKSGPANFERTVISSAEKQSFESSPT